MQKKYYPNWSKKCLMTLKKITILFLSIFLTAFLSDENANKSIPLINNQQSNRLAKDIDSVKSAIKTYGWNKRFLSSYELYLKNSDLDLNTEKEFISLLPQGFEKDFLLALVYKREKKFQAMFNLLKRNFKTYPAHFEFYDELVFSAAVTGKTDSLTSISLSSQTENKYTNYLNGLIQSQRGEYSLAVKSFNSLLKNSGENIYALFQLSYALRGLGNYSEAEKIIYKAIRLSKKNDFYLLGEEYLALGSLYFLSGNYNKANELYHAGEKYSEKNFLNTTKIKALIDIGIINDINGKTSKARKLFIEASDLAKQIQYSEGEAFAYSELGVSYSFTNDLVDAKDYYLLSYKIYKRLNNKIRLSLLANNIGLLQMQQFNYSAALKSFKEGNEFASENSRAKILNLIGIADVYTNLSNYSKALYYYNQAKSISLKIKQIDLNAQIDLGLGSLNFNLDNYHRALKYFSSGNELLNEKENPFDKANLYNKIGLSYFKLDSLDRAKEFFKKSIFLAEKLQDYSTSVSSMIDLSLLLIKQDEAAEAKEILQTALNKSLKEDLKFSAAEAYLLLGEIAFQEKNFKMAARNFTSCLKLSNDLNQPDLQIEANYALARLFSFNGMNEAADSYFTTAINIIENVSRSLYKDESIQIPYFSSKSDIYFSFADFQLNNKNYKKAFELIDKSRSRNTLQNIINLKLQSSIKDTSLLNKLYDYDWQINSGVLSKSKKDSVKLKYFSLKEKFISIDKSLAKYLDFNSSSSIEQTEKQLNDEEYVLSFYSNENGTYIFSISNEGFKTEKINLRKSDVVKLASDISPYFKDNPDEKSPYFFNQDLFAFNAAASYNFYIKLVAPAIANVPKNKKIIIIPSTELVILPFEFLVTENDSSGSQYNYENKKFLIYDYDISYSPSLSVYNEQKGNALKNNSQVILFGNPAIKNQSELFAERRGLLEEKTGLPRSFALLPLKYSAEEVNQISDIISADKIFTSESATETNFKNYAPYSKIIHLSTHSFLVNKQPLIFFSNTNDLTNDGFLEVGEIEQLKLNSDLVVLSSCSSGLGAIDKTEGILGMTKAFYDAGAKSSLVSLWEVNDKFTSKFMAEFYKQLNEGKDKSTALRVAKINFIKKYSANPYYWASFILSGNTAPIETQTSIGKISFLLTILIVLLISFAIIFTVKNNGYKIKKS